MRRFMTFLLLAIIAGLLPVGCAPAVKQTSISSAEVVGEDVAVSSSGDPAVGISAEEVAVESQVSIADGGLADDEGFSDEEDFTNGDIETIAVNDPIEPFNRGMFWVNDKLYFYLFKPIARGYRVVPEPARESVSNFFSNLGTPVRFANSILQLKFEDAGTELGRLIINSTLGIGGLFDPAKAWFDLDRKEEDFGQTLGNYGVGSGFYIVWPIFGPSNARDTVGMVGDFFMDPLHYVDMKPLERVGLTALDKETDLSLDKDTYESVKQEALDPYLYVRNAYQQYRDGKIKK
jgi:phospholipid-binding lipoprotein MlaA